MSSRASILVYYDVVSPYSYIGVKLLNRFRTQWKDVDVVYRPVFLGGVMSVRGIRVNAIRGTRDSLALIQFPDGSVLTFDLLGIAEPASGYRPCKGRLHGTTSCFGKKSWL